MLKAAFFISQGGAMQPVTDQLQKAKEHRPNERRLLPSRPVPEDREDGQNGNGTKADEDDLRIMQHFVRDLIEGS